MHRRAAAVLLTLALTAGFSSCSSKNDNPTVGPTSDDTPLSTAPTSTTTAPKTTTSVTAPSGPAKTEDAAALGLFNAWKRGDTPANRNDASHYAKPQAINQLFAHPYTNDGTAYANQGCEPQGGQFICSWTYPGGALQMTVEAWPGGGFVVDSVTYVAD